MIETRPSNFHEPDVPPASVYDQCVRCGLCLPSCPTYVETLVETSGPRGRIALIKAVDEGRLDLTSAGFIHQMSECLDCRACANVCPSGVEYGKLLEPARTQIERATVATQPPGRRLGRWFALSVLFKHLWTMRAVARLLRFYETSGLRALVRGSGILGVLGLDELEAMAPKISDRFFVPRDEHWPSLTEPAKTTAFLHAGCIMQVAYALTNAATVDVLRRSGCNVVVPSSQGCCGAIAVHAGDLDAGRELAKRNIVAFEDSCADVYVVNAAGCGSALKEYGDLFNDDPQWSTRAHVFASHVRDVTEFLDTIGLGPGLGKLPDVVTYQEPCHLVHAQRISAAPRRLLAQIPGIELREMNESSLCCGSAGVYNITQPEMAQRLGKRKIENALATRPTTIATANPGCALQLTNHLRSAEHPEVAVKHIVDLLAESYAAGDAS
jgi:glycolate oxidase iron-sulfur subunit